MTRDKHSERAQELEALLEEARSRTADAQSRLDDAQRSLDSLEREAPRVDALRNLVDAFENLKQHGGECPIFGGPVDAERYDRLAARYTQEIEGFGSRLPDVQEARDSAEADFRNANEEVERLQGELEQVRRKSRKAALAERRRELASYGRELIGSGAEPMREMRVAWGGAQEDDRYLKRLVVLMLILSIELSIWIPMIHLPPPNLPEQEKIPERLTKLLVEREKKPEPKPVKQKKPAKVAEKKPEEKPKPKEAPKEEKPREELKPKKKAPEPTTTAESEARKRASQSGLLAMSDDLQQLADESVADKLGTQANISDKGQKAAKVKRDIVTAEASQSSGGIQTSKLSRNVGGSGGSVGKRETSRVQSAMAEGEAQAQRAAQTRQGKAGRTDEEIQIVFDRNKSALYRIYNRALRKDPTLQGKVTLKLTIEPSGRVSACKVISSELDAPVLEKKIAERVRLFDFGKKDVAPLTITYPIDFLPA